MNQIKNQLRYSIRLIKIEGLIILKIFLIFGLINWNEMDSIK